MRCLMLAGAVLLSVAVAGEPELITDQEIAQLRAQAEQARAGTLPEMMPRQEVERLRAALKVNPRNQAEAKLAEFRRQALADWELLHRWGGDTADKLRAGGSSQPELHQIRRLLATVPAQAGKSRRSLDVAEGRITRASAEAEIAAARKMIGDLEAKLAAAPKESETALNPERYRQEQTAKINAQIEAARAQLAAAEAKLAAVDEVLGKPGADF